MKNLYLFSNIVVLSFFLLIGLNDIPKGQLIFEYFICSFLIRVAAELLFKEDKK